MNVIYFNIKKKKRLGIYPNTPINGSANAQCGKQETDVTAEKVFLHKIVKFSFSKYNICCIWKTK